MPTTTPIPPEVAADPRVINVAVYAAITVIVVATFPKLLGPLRQTWVSWVQGARRAQDEEHKADIAALNAKVELLSRLLDDYRQEVEDMRREHRAEVDEMRAEQAAHNDVLADHASYDQAMIQLVIRLGGKPLTYQPLYPSGGTNPPPAPRRTTAAHPPT